LYNTQLEGIEFFSFFDYSLRYIENDLQQERVETVQWWDHTRSWTPRSESYAGQSRRNGGRGWNTV